MTPMTRSRLGRVTERGFRGCRSQAVAPFFPAAALWYKNSNVLLVRLHSPYNRDVRHSQHVLDFRLLQPRSIVFELQPVLFFVQPEFLQAVRVGEKSQCP